MTQSYASAFDPNGERIWDRPINGPSWVRVNDVVVGADHFVFVAGEVAESLPGQVSAGGLWDGFIAAFDAADGAEIWTR